MIEVILIILFIIYLYMIGKIVSFNQYDVINKQLNQLIYYYTINKLQDCFIFDRESKLIISKDYQIAYDLDNKQIIIYDKYNDEMDINLNVKEVFFNPILIYYYIKLKKLFNTLNLATLELR